MQRIFFPSSGPKFVNEQEVVSKLKKLSMRLSKDDKRIKEIYLFGSYAQGNAGLHSDADILIVLQEDKRKMIDRLDEFILSFVDAPVPVDVLVYTQDEIKKGLEKKNSFLTKAISGVKLV